VIRRARRADDPREGDVSTGEPSRLADGRTPDAIWLDDHTLLVEV
jgi:hypothetical protein